MKKSFKKTAIFLTSLLSISASTVSLADITAPMVVEHFFDKAQKNDSWKSAFATGQHAQIVFMSVSAQTNPQNEIGMETHRFDQIILIVDGNAKVILNGNTSMAKSGDLIFIPQGTAHNVINLNADKPLKIASIYSATDIPAKSNYPKKSDEPKG